MNSSNTPSPIDSQAFAVADPDVTIVIPVYNESGRIERSLREVIAWASRREETIEILVVDDGSTDSTATIAEVIAAESAIINVLREPHLGKANAVLAGLAAARGHYAGFCDVDLATPLATWDSCRAALEGGAGVAIASREGVGAIRVGEPRYRHVMGRAFNGLVRLLLLPGIHDTQCGFKFFSRRALDIILPRNRLYRDAEAVTRPRVTAFDVELLYIAHRHGLRISVIPITWNYGEYTKVNPITDTLQNLRDVLQVRLNGWLGRYD